MARIQGKTAIVTGAGQGIGEAIARCLTGEGARVVGIDRNAEKLQVVCRSLPGAMACPLDVTDHAALQRAVAQALETFGRIDIVVNNAAISYYTPLVETSLEEWRQTLAINLEAYFVLSKLVARSMIPHRFGRIVNIASTQAIACEPLVGAYAASKGGVLALTRSLAVELAPHEILVNAVAPGCIHTPMSIVNGVDETQSELFQEWYVRRRKIPLGRPGEPHEVAGLVLFLASEDCQYMTGQMLVIDGGLTITF